MVRRPSWDPWQDVRRLQRDIEHLFERGGRGGVNITQTPDGLVFVEAVCPGADKETLEVTVIGDTLTIKGERKPEAGVGEAQYHRRQRVTGPFTRTVRLGERIDADQVQATYAHGILLVQLARAPEASPKRIAIRS
jgi:HSP20 family protein